jgi:hypothetical protein
MSRTVLLRTRCRINRYVARPFFDLQEGETALHKACKMSNVKVVQRLIEYTDNKPEIPTRDYINAVNFKVG